MANTNYIIYKLCFAVVDFYMSFRAKVDDNPTKHVIINLLKVNDGMTIEDLSKQIKITPMGVRQHLITLEKRGLVRYESRKRGVGRPGFLYMLTDKAEELFPKTYEKFLLEMIAAISESEGPEKVDEYFRRRSHRIFDFQRSRAQATDRQKDLTRLKDHLENEGYMIDFSRSNGYYKLSNFNCPILSVARRYEGACSSELERYRELFGESTKLVQKIVDGECACIYLIPAE